MNFPRFLKRRKAKKAIDLVAFEYLDEFLQSLERNERDVVRKETIENSITLTYQDDKWLEERVLIDGIQNHLPSDSGGEWFGLEIMVEGQWRPYSFLENIKNKEVEAVRFFDNGTGFISDELRVFSSSKSSDTASRGQFGEGLKMISAAALRLGMEMAIDSRNWRAVPGFRKLQLTGRQEEQLIFNVVHYQESIKGSVTTFYNVSPKFVEVLRNIGSFVLPALGDNYKPIYSCDAGDIIDIGQRHFVKGLYFPSPGIRSMFSYNFNLIDGRSVNRDRDQIKEDEFKSNVGKILANMEDKDLIRQICEAGLKAAHGDEIAEFEALGSYKFMLQYMPLNIRRIYFETVSEIVGGGDIRIVNGIVSLRVQKAFEAKGGKLLFIHNFWFRNFLEKCGFKELSDKEIEKISEKEKDKRSGKETKVTTSFTLEYAPKNWTEERILIDAVQNHTQSDSGGECSISVWVGGKWIPIGNHQINSPSIMDKLFGRTDIGALKIEDDGKGYPVEFLQLAYSSKDRNQTRGMHGEGLKMLSVAALRLDMDVVFESRDWRAQAYAERLDIENEAIHRLGFDISVSENPRKGSATIFRNLTPKFMEQIIELSENILTLNQDYKPLARTVYGDIVEKGKGVVYVKDLKVTDKEKGSLIFSYNFSDNTGFDSRDRDVFSLSMLKSKIGALVAEVSNREAIEYFLQYAAKHHEDQMVEYQEYALGAKQKRVWKKAFIKVFGKMAVLDTMPEAISNARTFGYEVIFMPKGIKKTLIDCGAPRDVDIFGTSDFVTVPVEDLTEAEREIFYLHEYLDEILKVNSAEKEAEIRIFAAAYGSNGVELNNLLGRWDKKKKLIYINRASLSDPMLFASVFIHERGHQLSGEGDYSREFVDFFTYAFAKFALAYRQEKVIL